MIETHSELNARCLRELGVSYDELMERSARVMRGEGIPHADAMRMLDSSPWLVNATETPKLPAGSTSPWLVTKP